MSWSIRVNGASREVDAGTTIKGLLELLAVRGDGVAVAVDTQVIPRSEHARWALHDGAEVEVIRAVGGG